MMNANGMLKNRFVGKALSLLAFAAAFVSFDALAPEAHAAQPEASVVVAYQSTSLSGENANAVYDYLTQNMGLNNAAACGVMANIAEESKFNPEAGSAYYGLCQWGGGRRSGLYTYTGAAGYSSASVLGQMAYLQHELETKYSGVLAALYAVEDSAAGAYEAAYTFCCGFEIPANLQATANRRGCAASSTYCMNGFDIPPAVYEPVEVVPVARQESNAYTPALPDGGQAAQQGQAEGRSLPAQQKLQGGEALEQRLVLQQGKAAAAASSAAKGAVRRAAANRQAKRETVSDDQYQLASASDSGGQDTGQLAARKPTGEIPILS